MRYGRGWPIRFAPVVADFFGGESPPKQTSDSLASATRFGENECRHRNGAWHDRRYPHRRGFRRVQEGSARLGFTNRSVARRRGLRCVPRRRSMVVLAARDQPATGRTRTQGFRLSRTAFTIAHPVCDFGFSEPLIPELISRNPARRSWSQVLVAGPGRRSWSQVLVASPGRKS